MSVINYINSNFINPLQSIPKQLHYSAKKKYNPLNNTGRKHHIIVSLTSFPARFGTLHYCLNSLFSQSMPPDLVFLCLSKEEVTDESVLPASVHEFRKYGLQIYITDQNLKPHNKYLSAMQLFPESLIITADDDCMYDINLISDLYNSYLNYPVAVSSRRVHKITADSNGNVLPYSKWDYEYKKNTKPSNYLLATGVGGVLYPPGILPAETFKADRIRELCLNADDIWLKFMELKNNIPVVWVKSNRVHPYTIIKAQKFNLQKNNYHDNQNDKYITLMQNYYKIKLIV